MRTGLWSLLGGLLLGWHIALLEQPNKGLDTRVDGWRRGRPRVSGSVPSHGRANTATLGGRL